MIIERKAFVEIGIDDFEGKLKHHSRQAYAELGRDIKFYMEQGEISKDCTVKFKEEDFEEELKSVYDQTIFDYVDIKVKGIKVTATIGGE